MSFCDTGTYENYRLQRFPFFLTMVLNQAELYSLRFRVNLGTVQSLDAFKVTLKSFRLYTSNHLRPVPNRHKKSKTAIFWDGRKCSSLIFRTKYLGSFFRTPKHVKVDFLTLILEFYIIEYNFCTVCDCAHYKICTSCWCRF